MIKKVNLKDEIDKIFDSGKGIKYIKGQVKVLVYSLADGFIVEDKPNEKKS